MLKTAKKIVNKSVKYKKHFALYIILNVYVLFFFLTQYHVRLTLLIMNRCAIYGCN